MQVTSEMCKRKDRGKKAKQRHSQSVRKPAPDDGHGNGGGSAGSDDLGGQVVEEEEEGEEEEGGMESGASDGNATGGRASSDCQRRTTKATHFARASPHSTRTHAYETKVKPRPATAAAKPMASAARVAEEPKQRALSASQFKSSPDLRKAGAEASHSSERHQPARCGNAGPKQSHLQLAVWRRCDLPTR